VGGTHYSADYPFTLAECLGRARGPEMLTIFTIGCAGDINHINVQSSAKQQGNTEAARIGTILAAKVLRTMEHLSTNLPSTNLRVSTELVQLPLPDFTPDQLQVGRQVAAAVESKAKQAPKFMDQVEAFKVLDVAD